MKATGKIRTLKRIRLSFSPKYAINARNTDSLIELVGIMEAEEKRNYIDYFTRILTNRRKELNLPKGDRLDAYNRFNNYVDPSKMIQISRTRRGRLLVMVCVSGNGQRRRSCLFPVGETEIS